MLNHQKKQSMDEKRAKVPFPTIPKVMENRISMKWLTMEALTKVNKMLSPDGPESRVIFLTPWGQVEGRLQEIQPSLAESYRKECSGDLSPDLASMVTHVRTDLLKLYEQEESQGKKQGEGQEKQQEKQSSGESKLQLVDNAPILSLTDVVLKDGSGTTNLSQLTLFADQIIGFSLVEPPKIH